MPFKYNPLTSDLDLVGAGVTIPPTYQAEKFELDATDISNKYVVLTQVPDIAANVRMQIIGGIAHSKKKRGKLTISEKAFIIVWLDCV